MMPNDSLQKVGKSWENDAQRFFANCWTTWLGKVGNMMPNDSLQNVGKVGKVRKMMSNDSLQNVEKLGKVGKH